MTRNKVIEILTARSNCIEKQIKGVCDRLPYYCDKCQLSYKQGNI